MRRTHDMGGLEAGKIELAPHDVAPWQKQTLAMRAVLGDEKRKLVRIDELRRAIGREDRLAETGPGHARAPNGPHRSRRRPAAISRPAIAPLATRSTRTPPVAAGGLDTGS